MVKLKAVAGVLAATAWIALAIVASGATPALASTLVVAPAGDTSCGQHTPYHTIQSAVNAAAPGAHIYVCPALYQEHVVISGPGKNNLNLEGASTNNTFIQFPVTPSSPDAIVLVDGATNVEVHRCTIEGPWNDANAAGCAQPTHYGVFVQGGGSARIEDVRTAGPTDGRRSPRETALTSAVHEPDVAADQAGDPRAIGEYSVKWGAGPWKTT